MFESILVPVDDSSHTFKAAEVAGDLAERFDANLTLLHVKPRSAIGSIIAPSADAPPADQISVDMSGVKDPVTDKIFLRAKEHVNRAKRDRTLLCIGDPVSEIVTFVRSNGVDLVVVGQSPSKGVLAKGDTNKLMRLVDCACLTVR